MSITISVKKRINDCIHGFIEVSDLELDIIDTRIFQRLRRIKQVSPADFVFPGATHTRFSHCLGAMHLMEQLLNHVKKEGQPIVQNREEKQKLRLAALLHDLGHYPLSHTGEKAVERVSGQGHEEFGMTLMKMFLQKELSSYSAEDISALIESEEPKDLYCQILSSDLDVDKLDYLLRDAYHAGVTYGQIDIQRIIRAMSFDENDNMVFEKAGSALENMLVGRYHVYQVINQHRAVTAFELMAERIYFELMKNGLMPKPNDLVKDNDELSLVTYDDNLLAQMMVQHLRKKELGFLTDLINMYLQREPLGAAWESSRLTSKKDFPVGRYAMKLLEDNESGELEKLTTKIKAQVNDFSSDWLFPISLKAIRILPENTPIYVRKKAGAQPIRVEEDEASLFKLVGENAIYNTRLYTKPGLQEKIAPIFREWARSVEPS